MVRRAGLLHSRESVFTNPPSRQRVQPFERAPTAESKLLMTVTIASENATDVDVDPSASFKVLAVQLPLLACESFWIRTVCPQVDR